MDDGAEEEKDVEAAEVELDMISGGDPGNPRSVIAYESGCYWSQKGGGGVGGMERANQRIGSTMRQRTTVDKYATGECM